VTVEILVLGYVSEQDTFTTAVDYRDPNPRLAIYTKYKKRNMLSAKTRRKKPTYKTHHINFKNKKPKNANVNTIV
jgi:hypothetical protein